MTKLLLLAALALGTAASAAPSCAATMTGTVKLADAHHVEYVATVRNPTAQPLTVNLRVDFFLKGKKLDGGFENLRATIPAGGKKEFKGRETFTQTLKGVDAVKVTKVRQCQ